MSSLRFCVRAFSSCGERWPLFIAMRGPLTIAASLVAEHRLQTRRLSSCGSWAQLLRGMWDLPRPGLKPMSPALTGRFSTTAPPGKPLLLVFYLSIGSLFLLSSFPVFFFVLVFWGVFFEYFLVFRFISVLDLLPIHLCFIFSGCSRVVVLTVSGLRTCLDSYRLFILLKIEDPKMFLFVCVVSIYLYATILKVITGKLLKYLLIYFKVIHCMLT